MRHAHPPVLLTDVFGDVRPVLDLLGTQAPYTPLGGWYSPDADPHVATRPMWFQNDWAHADEVAPGAELVLHHPAYLDAARSFYGAEIVEPKSVYVNHMMALAEGGPAHTDNPRFHGRDRTNTPMWLLRTMWWSGLFDQHEILQATAIWWLNDVDGGGLRYWPDGPDHDPVDHVGAMADTALFGDNHGMFHQVGPVGPVDDGTRRVTPMAELAPAADGSGDWVVDDHGRTVFRAPLDDIRVSVLWKADVHHDAETMARGEAHALSMLDVAAEFQRDLDDRDAEVTFDLDRLDDPELRRGLTTVYPEARPVGAWPSVFAR